MKESAFRSTCTRQQCSAALLTLVVVGSIFLYSIEQEYVRSAVRRASSEDTVAFLRSVREVCADAVVQAGTWQAWAALLVSTAFSAAFWRAYSYVRGIIVEVRARTRARARTQLRHSTDFAQRCNAELSTPYASLLEAIGISVLQYVTEPVQLVTFGVILLQGAASAWTRHRPNTAMYVCFLIVSVVGETIAYLRARSTDEAVNSETYECALVRAGARVWTRVRSDHIGFGVCVRVPPGRRVPVDGYVLASSDALVSAAPFAYAVCGENTVLNPAIAAVADDAARAVTWERVDSVEYFADAAQAADHVAAHREALKKRSASTSDSGVPELPPTLRLARSATSPSGPPSVPRFLRATSAITLEEADLEAVAARRKVPGVIASHVAAMHAALSRSSPSLTQRHTTTASTSGAGAFPQLPALTPPSGAGTDAVVVNETVLLTAERVPRGTVHAPDAASASEPLLLLSALPAQWAHTSTQARRRNESEWQLLVARVFQVQALVLLLVSLHGWISAQQHRSEPVTVASFIGFMAGQFVMGNTLLPMREGLIDAMWLGLVKQLFPAVSLTVPAALETMRRVVHVVSDKTGTLTSEHMDYDVPISNPDYGDPLGLGYALLFVTNDSTANPMYTAAGADARLAATPALCTTPEEGAIFHALTRAGASDGYDVSLRKVGAAGLEQQTIRCRSSGAEYAVTYLYRGDFEPDHVARYSVVTVRDESTGSTSTPMLVAQGGSDAVASWCGERAAAWERHLLTSDPRRTLAHAIAAWPMQSSGTVEALSRDAVITAHLKAKQDNLYQLAYLSKFTNPLVTGAEDLQASLASLGARLHVCSGDTFLTLQAVLQQLRILPQASSDCASTSVHSVTWDATAAQMLQHELAADSTVRGPIAAALSASASVSRLVVFCDANSLRALHTHRRHRDVQSLLSNSKLTFAFFRIKQVLKPLAVELLQTAVQLTDGEDCQTRVAFLGDGPNDALALAATSNSVAIHGRCVAAREAANIQVQDCTALPQVMVMARLYQGGRAVLLRDILFTGTYVVVTLALSGHFSKFSTIMGRRIRILDEPWSPLTMVIFTSLIHTPRMLTCAVNDGYLSKWSQHSTFVYRVMFEVALATMCALMVGLRFRNAVDSTVESLTSREADVSDALMLTAITPSATTIAQALRQTFAPLALVAMAVVVLLRQNIVTSQQVFRLPVWLNGLLGRRLEGDERAAFDDLQRWMPSGVRRVAGAVVWTLNSLAAQLCLLLLYLLWNTNTWAQAWFCVRTVSSAVFGPLLLFALLRAARFIVEDRAG